MLRATSGQDRRQAEHEHAKAQPEQELGESSWTTEAASHGSALLIRVMGDMVSVGDIARTLPPLAREQSSMCSVETVHVTRSDPATATGYSREETLES